MPTECLSGEGVGLPIGESLGQRVADKVRQDSRFGPSFVDILQAVPILGAYGASRANGDGFLSRSKHCCECTGCLGYGNQDET